MPHITQLAAVKPDKVFVFESFVIPKVPITNKASEVTGIITSGRDCMTVHGKQVLTVPVMQAGEDLFGWLEGFSNVILVAHNGRRFGFPVFITVSKLGMLPRFFSLVSDMYYV